MKELSLRKKILLDKLNSDLAIFTAKFEAERRFSLNTAMIVQAQITEAIIEEIKKQISLVETSTEE